MEIQSYNERRKNNLWNSIENLIPKGFFDYCSDIFLESKDEQLFSHARLNGFVADSNKDASMLKEKANLYYMFDYDILNDILSKRLLRYLKPVIDDCIDDMDKWFNKNGIYFSLDIKTNDYLKGFNKIYNPIRKKIEFFNSDHNFNKVQIIESYTLVKDKYKKNKVYIKDSHLTNRELMYSYGKTLIFKIDPKEIIIDTDEVRKIFKKWLNNEKN